MANERMPPRQVPKHASGCGHPSCEGAFVSGAAWRSMQREISADSVTKAARKWVAENMNATVPEPEELMREELAHQHDKGFCTGNPDCPRCQSLRPVPAEERGRVAAELERLAKWTEHQTHDMAQVRRSRPEYPRGNRLATDVRTTLRRAAELLRTHPAPQEPAGVDERMREFTKLLDTALASYAYTESHSTTEIEAARSAVLDFVRQALSKEGA